MVRSSVSWTRGGLRARGLGLVRMARCLRAAQATSSWPQGCDPWEPGQRDFYFRQF